MRPSPLLCFSYRFVFLFLISQIFVLCTKDSSSSNPTAVQSASSDDALKIDLFRGLVAWYPFNGDTYDHSKHGNKVEFNSAEACRGYFGKKNNAFRFDGVSSYMRVANNGSLNPREGISLYAFVKPEGFYQGPCHANYIIGKGNTSNPSGTYGLVFSDARYYHNTQCSKPVAEAFEDFYGGFGSTANVHDSLDYIVVNKWYKVVYTYDGKQSRIYVNGELKSVDLQTTFVSGSTNDLFFGKYENSQYPYFFKGIIDEIRIYNRALNANEVKIL